MNAQEKYLEEAALWHTEVFLTLRRNYKIACIVAAISLLLACLSVFALAAIAPLKTVEPYVIEVDKATGEAKVLTEYKGDVQQLTIEKSLSKYFLNKYLIARESHDPKLDLEDNYRVVQNMSEGEAFRMYSKRFGTDHPDNPFTKYGDNTVEVEVRSISFLRSDTATIRYELVQTTQENEIRTQWIDIVSFKYTNPPTTEQARLKNPLGFKVTEYRTDREVVK